MLEIPDGVVRIQDEIIFLVTDPENHEAVRGNEDCRNEGQSV